MNETSKRTPRCAPILFALAAALLLFTASAFAGDKAQAKKQQPTKAAASTNNYVGADTCRGCHEDMFKKFETTPHWKTTFDTRRGPEWQGCEACHGPGADHVAGGGDKTKIWSFKGKTAKEISERCLQCHQYGEEHANYTRSVHKINDVSCVDCHSPHHAKEEQYLLAKSQPQLCYTCHLEQRPDFSRPFHHRVNEGLIKCTDCHNQHGGFLTKQLRSTSAQDVVCFKCHADKAGPFTFEHVPIKTEGCMICHVPHGSSNPKMLRRTQVNLLCLECHTLAGGGLPPGGPTHDQSQKYQACTMCHQAIHGSMMDRVFFR